MGDLLNSPYARVTGDVCKYVLREFARDGSKFMSKVFRRIKSENPVLLSELEDIVSDINRCKYSVSKLKQMEKEFGMAAEVALSEHFLKAIPDPAKRKEYSRGFWEGVMFYYEALRWQARENNTKEMYSGLAKVTKYFAENKRMRITEDGLPILAADKDADSGSSSLIKSLRTYPCPYVIIEGLLVKQMREESPEACSRIIEHIKDSSKEYQDGFDFGASTVRAIFSMEYCRFEKARHLCLKRGMIKGIKSVSPIRK